MTEPLRCPRCGNDAQTRRDGHNKGVPRGYCGACRRAWVIGRPQRQQRQPLNIHEKLLRYPAGIRAIDLWRQETKTPYARGVYVALEHLKEQGLAWRDKDKRWHARTIPPPEREWLFSQEEIEILILALADGQGSFADRDVHRLLVWAENVRVHGTMLKAVLQGKASVILDAKGKVSLRHRAPSTADEEPA